MTDEGMTFFATVRTPDGSQQHRETEDRAAFLHWLATHYHDGDELTITLEARGAAALATMKALTFGLWSQHVAQTPGTT